MDDFALVGEAVEEAIQDALEAILGLNAVEAQRAAKRAAGAALEALIEDGIVGQEE